MRKWLNYWLNDYCGGSYPFALFTLSIMGIGASVGLLFALVLLVATRGFILLLPLAVGGVWYVLRWADEERT